MIEKRKVYKEKPSRRSVSDPGGPLCQQYFVECARVEINKNIPNHPPPFLQNESNFTNERLTIAVILPSIMHLPDFKAPKGISPLTTI